MKHRMTRSFAVAIALLLVARMLLPAVNSFASLQDTSASLNSTEPEAQQISEQTVSYQTATVEQGSYFIKNIGQSAYLRADSGSVSSPRTALYEASQYCIWTIQPITSDNGETYYTIRNRQTSYYLACTRISGAFRLTLTSSVSSFCYWYIYSTNNGYAFAPYMALGNVVFAQGGSNFAVASSDPSSFITIEQTHNHEWEMFRLASIIGDCYLQNCETSRFAAPSAGQTYAGATIRQWNFSTASTNQKWTAVLNNGTDLTYMIKNSLTNLYLGYNPSSGVGSTLKQYGSESGESCIKWYVFRSQSGNLVFTPAIMEPFSYAMSVNPSTNAQASTIVLTAYSNDTNYKDEWRIIKPADYAGALSAVWDSNGDTISYWDMTDRNRFLNFYIDTQIDSSISFFRIWLSTAISQWEDLLGVHFVETLNMSDADIRIIYGDYYYLSEKGVSLNLENNEIGLTVLNISNNSTDKKLMNFSNDNPTDANIFVKTGKILTAKIGILPYTNTSIATNVCTHELGHAMGYDNHALHEDDVMRPVTQTDYSLKNCEKNHIKSIYDFYR